MDAAGPDVVSRGDRSRGARLAAWWRDLVTPVGLPYTILGVGVALFQVVRLLASNEVGRVEFAQDDAYYYFQIARNIAAGHGSTWDGINQTNGYHPLWMLMLVPVFFFVRGNVAGMIATKVLTALLWCADVVQVRRIAALVGMESTFWIGMLPAVLSTVVIVKSFPFNGVETGVLVLFLLVLMRRIIATGLLRGDPPATGRAGRDAWLTGVVCALVVLSRLDAVFVLVFFLGAVGVAMLRRRRPASEVLRASLALGLPTVIALSAYLGFNQVVFDSAMPVSGRAKQVFPAAPGWDSLRSYFTEGAGVPGPIGPGLIATVIVAAVIVTMVATRRRAADGSQGDAARDLSVLLVLLYVSGLVMVAYYDRTSSWKLFSWYYYQAFLVLLLGPGLVVGRLADVWSARSGRTPMRGVGPRRAGAAVAVLALALLLAAGAGVVTRIDRTGTENFYAVSAVAAERLNRELPADAIVAMGDRAGAFGYLLDRPVVSLEGVVNSAEFLRALEDVQVREFMVDTGVTHYARSVYVAEEEDAVPARDRGGVVAGSCGFRLEPQFGTGHLKTPIQVCGDEVVYSSPEGYDDRFTIWRYPSGPLEAVAAARAAARPR